MEWISSLFLIGYGRRSKTSFVNKCIKKNFRILTNKCRNNLKYENEDPGFPFIGSDQTYTEKNLLSSLPKRALPLEYIGFTV